MSSDAHPCTGLFLPQSPDGVVAANMDWPTGQGLIFINKRDVQKTSAFVSPPQTPLQWTSKYMSITLTPTGLEFPWDGMNEMGLSAITMQLESTVLPPADSTPAVNGIQWLQYILDTSATTAEAISNAQSVRVTGPYGVQAHYFVCDATGSCAVFEYVNGLLVINQGASLPYMALSNNTYSQSYQNLLSLLGTFPASEILGFGGQDSLTRFAQAAIYSSQYSPQAEEVSYAFSALNTIEETTPPTPTQWNMAFSVANKTLQYKTVAAPFVKYIDLLQFNPSCSSGTMVHYLNGLTSGDMTSSFSNYNAAINYALVAANSGGDSPATLSVIQNYPSTTQCMETATTLSSSANPASSGQTVDLTAQVTGNGNNPPTGTVTFQDGAALLGTATLDSLGAAQFAVSILPPGTSFLTAAYSGDAFNNASTSSPFSQGVGVQSTQTVLTSSPNPANVSQSVTLTATVTGQGPGVPTGTVTFQSGATVLGTATLNSSGVAQFAPSPISAGTNPIMATYSGDGINGTSTSSALIQVINSQTTQTELTSSLNPSDVDQPAIFTATVAGQYGVVPTGTVTFRFNGNAVAPIVRLQNGQGTISRAFFPSGSRSVTATYSGDSNSQPSASSSLSQAVNVQPTQITLASSINPSGAGQPVTFTVTVAGQYGGVPTGTVTFSVNNSPVAVVSVSNGQATYTSEFPATGTPTVSATYSGDSNDQPSTSSPFSQVVNALQATQTSLFSSQSPSPVGQSVTFTATVAGQSGGSPTGTVTFTISGNNPVTVLLANGQASFTWTFLHSGTRTVTASYSGDSGNQASTSPPLSQVVNGQPTQIALTSSANPSNVGESVTYTATVTAANGGATTGTVTFSISGNNPASVPLTNGQAIYTWIFLNSGTRTVTASYSGDSNNQASTSSSLSQVVNGQPTQVALTSSLSPSTTGQAVTFTATVAGPSGVPTGTATFNINGNNPATQPLTNGQATYTWTFLHSGTRAVTASYSGDSSNPPGASASLSQVVNGQPTQVTLTSSMNPSIVGQPVTYTAVVTAGNGRATTGTVIFSISGNIPATVAMTNGQATFTWTFLNGGTRTVTASYSGDSNNQASTSSSLSQVVTTQVSLASSINPASVGQPVTFTAAVAGQNGVPTGTVAFNISGNNPATVALTNGQASFNWTFLHAGTRAVTATYSGDSSNPAGTSSSLSQAVNTQPTQVALASSMNPASVGQAITFTATVAGQYSGVPTGTVTFSISGSNPATVPLTNGQASYTASFAATGAPSVSASYSGDINDQPSASTSLSEAVNAQPTQITLVSSANPASVGQTVTFTAAVAGQYGGSPTGTVTFSVNNNAVATMSISNGLAIYTTSFAASGTQTVSAAYSGDSNDLPSASSSLSQSVN